MIANMSSKFKRSTLLAGNDVDSSPQRLLFHRAEGCCCLTLVTVQLGSPSSGLFQVVPYPKKPQPDDDDNPQPAEAVDDQGQSHFSLGQIGLRLVRVEMVATVVAEPRLDDHRPDRTEIPRPRTRPERSAATLRASLAGGHWRAGSRDRRRSCSRDRRRCGSRNRRDVTRTAAMRAGPVPARRVSISFELLVAVRTVDDIGHGC